MADLPETQFADLDAHLKGRKRGLMIGMVTFFACALLLSLFPKRYQGVELKVEMTRDMSALKQISTGLVMYSSDHDDAFPNASQWQDKVEAFVKPEVFKRVSVKANGFAFNSSLSDMNANRLPNEAETAMSFSSIKIDRNAHDSCESLYFYGGKAIIGYADGHVHSVVQTDKVLLDHKGTRLKFSEK